MRRRTKEKQPPIFSIYAIYDNTIDDRIYKLSYCYAYKLPQIQRYYEHNERRSIDIVFDYFSLKYTKQPIETYLQDMDEKLDPVIRHEYTKEGNRKRIKKARQDIPYLDLPQSVFTRNGDISERHLLKYLFHNALNEPYTIGNLQDEYINQYAELIDPDFIPLDFWNYGLTINDLPQNLQRKYAAMQD